MPITHLLNTLNVSVIIIISIVGPDVKIPPQIIPRPTPLPDLSLFLVGVVLPQFKKGAGAGRWGSQADWGAGWLRSGLGGEHFRLN